MSDDKSNGAGDLPPIEGSEAQTPVPLDEQIRRAEAEAADLKDRLLRALAETENVRRRAERERTDATKYGVTQLARDLLDVADNLRRAIESVPEAQVRDDAIRNLLAGVAATERALLAAFERHGIRRLDPKGERFDHNFHQAIFEAENTGKPAGTVVEVLQPGYVLHDRLLRPAMVGVAKGEPKPGRGNGSSDNGPDNGDRKDPPALRFDTVV
ncbi:MAG TPA: nucleotide exchange factor GrpE [Stellaceae bacterium]|nr:nucleotide exchange factor GrpE [Stellaceae bacterium]